MLDDSANTQRPGEFYYAKEAIQIGGYCPTYILGPAFRGTQVHQAVRIDPHADHLRVPEKPHPLGASFNDWNMIDCSLVAGSHLLPHSNKQQLERTSTVCQHSA